MNPISPLTHLSQIIRKKLQDTQASKGTAGSAKAAIKTTKKTNIQKETKDALRAKIEASLRVLSDRDRSGDKGIKVLVTYILHWSFDNYIHKDSKIENIIDNVTKTILDDDIASQHAKTLINELCYKK